MADELLGAVELLFGEQAGLDALGELDLLLGVEQGDLADLLEVVLDRVGGGAGDGDLLDGLVGLVAVRDDEALLLGLLRQLLGDLFVTDRQAVVGDGDLDGRGLGGRRPSWLLASSSAAFFALDAAFLAARPS